MIRYIHGSEDSLDVDVYYVFDELPSFAECRKFCSEDINENRNIIVIKDGIVTDCFIGTIDEINNGLIDTYFLHEQKYPLLLTKRVKRDIIKKSIRSTRGIISLLSKTQYRKEIKKALNSNWIERLDCLDNIDFASIDYNSLDKQYDGTHIKKVIAFQIGQTLGLFDGIELYTKSSIAIQYPGLKKFLYREDADDNILNQYIQILLEKLRLLETVKLSDREVLFIKSGRKFDLKHEIEL